MYPAFMNPPEYGCFTRHRHIPHPLFLLDRSRKGVARDEPQMEPGNENPRYQPGIEDHSDPSRATPDARATPRPLTKPGTIASPQETAGAEEPGIRIRNDEGSQEIIHWHRLSTPRPMGDFCERMVWVDRKGKPPAKEATGPGWQKRL